MTVTPITDARRRKRGIVEIRTEYFYYLEEASANGWSDKLPCYRDPDAFSEFVKAPTQAEAREKCAPCPVLELCNEYAWATRMQRRDGFLIYGGVAWRATKPTEPEVEPLNIAHPKQPAPIQKAA